MRAQWKSCYKAPALAVNNVTLELPPVCRNRTALSLKTAPTRAGKKSKIYETGVIPGILRALKLSTQNIAFF